MTITKQRWYFLTFGIGVLLLISAIAVVREQFLVTHIVLHNVPSDSLVHINGRPYDLDRTASNTITLTLSVGSHEIGITKDDYWTWVKRIPTARNTTVNITPFLLPKKIDATSLSPGTATYTAAVSAFAQSPLPTKETPVISSDGLVGLYVESTSDFSRHTMRADWLGSTSSLPEYFCEETCSKTRDVTAVATPIRTIAFLGDRHDVVVFAASAGIFAIEIDDRGVQNFQPIFAGTIPEFRLAPNAAFYIKDGFRFSTINL